MIRSQSSTHSYNVCAGAGTTPSVWGSTWSGETSISFETRTKDLTGVEVSNKLEVKINEEQLDYLVERLQVVKREYVQSRADKAAKETKLSPSDAALAS